MHDGKNSAFNDNTLLIQVNDLISTLDFHLIKKQEGEPSRQKVEDPVVHCLQFHFSSVFLVLSIAGERVVPVWCGAQSRSEIRVQSGVISAQSLL